MSISCLSAIDISILPAIQELLGENSSESLNGIQSLDLYFCHHSVAAVSLSSASPSSPCLLFGLRCGVLCELEMVFTRNNDMKKGSDTPIPGEDTSQNVGDPATALALEKSELNEFYFEHTCQILLVEHSSLKLNTKERRVHLAEYHSSKNSITLVASAGYDNQLKLWDIAENTLVKNYNVGMIEHGEKAKITAISFNCETDHLGITINISQKIMSLLLW